MKAKIKIFILFIGLISGAWIAPQKAAAQVSVSFQVFYDDLSPYGSWVDNPDYGYVWVPNVAAGFTPYGTNGYWVFTDAGWTWVSDYPWGWAPFHYGRWFSDPMYGQMWVPGNEWGPGWVSWRSSEGYYGWAPIGPGVSASVAYSNGYNVPSNRWTFVKNEDFGKKNIYNYHVARSGNTAIIKNSRVINNVQMDKTSKVSYNAGPDRAEVQKRTGTTVAPVALKESNKPGQSMSNGALQIYRPHVETNTTAGKKPAPAKVENLKDMKPMAKRTAATQPQKGNQVNKAQPSQQQHGVQPVKPLLSQQPHGVQPVKPKPSQNQPNNQPVNNQPAIHNHKAQPARQQPSQQQDKSQPNKAQPSQPQHPQPSRPEQANPPHIKGGENPQQPKAEPRREQQPQHSEPPAMEHPSQPQPKAEPIHEQQPQRSEPSPPENHQQSQPQQSNPAPNREEEGRPHLKNQII